LIRIEEARVRALLREAADLPLPDDSDDLFQKLVGSLIKSDPKRAIALMAVPESKTLVDRPAKISRAAAMLKMTISDSLLPQFRNFATPQQIFDEVFGWEVEARRCTIPILRTKMQGLRMAALEQPKDYFYRAKGIVEELALAGVMTEEWDAVSYMLAGVIHDRFTYVRGYFADMAVSDLKFLDVVARFSKAETNNMLLPHSSANYPPYLKPTHPSSPAYAANIFPPAGGRGAGGRGAGGPGRSGRGRGFISGASETRGGRSSLICSHCGKPGHSDATCYKLHPEMAPGASKSRPGPAQSPCTPAEYKALLATLAQYQN
jgi:hypothetical protein